jgi:hypothetical protein
MCVAKAASSAPKLNITCRRTSGRSRNIANVDVDRVIPR